MASEATNVVPDRVPLFVAAPPVLLAVLCVVLIGLGTLGANPFWQTADLTLSEATALRDRATVVALLQRGADPVRAYSVRSGLISSRELSLTPMEAAIHEDRADMAELLLSYGLRGTDARVCSWLALAGDSKREVREYLRHRYANESTRCVNASSPEDKAERVSHP